MAHRMRHRRKEKELSPWISNTTRHPTRSQPNWKEFGLRSLAKLMLNSFWGKFGQRPNQTQVSSCTKPSEFFQIITDDRQVIHRIEIVNEHMVEVFHNFQEKTIPVQTNVNIFIALLHHLIHSAQALWCSWHITRKSIILWHWFSYLHKETHSSNHSHRELSRTVYQWTRRGRPYCGVRGSRT